MTIPLPSLTASSAAKSMAQNRLNNSFSTGDLIAGGGSKNNKELIYLIGGIAVFALLLNRKGR